MGVIDDPSSPMVAPAAQSSSPSTLSTIAGAIPVVGGVLSGLINNASVNSANAANRAFQEQQQQQQNAYNLQMWNMQNAYNSPSAQMARYKAAGLNPNLIYGSATSNVASPPPQSAKVDFVQQPHPSMDLATPLANGVRAFNDTRLGDAQVNNLQAQTTNTSQDTVVKQLVGLLTQAQTDKTNAETSAIPSQIANTQANTVKAMTDASVESFLAPYDAAIKDAQVSNLGADTQFKVDDNVRQAALSSTSIREAIARMSSMAVQNAKSQAEIQQINANTGLLLNSKELSSMDVDMRNQGLMPHDGPVMRALSGIFTWLTGVNSSGGMQHDGGSTGNSYTPPKAPWDNVPVH